MYEKDTQDYGSVARDLPTLSDRIRNRIKELEFELIELKALSNILATEPLIDKLLSGEQGRKFKRFLY